MVAERDEWGWVLLRPRRTHAPFMWRKQHLVPSSVLALETRVRLVERVLASAMDEWDGTLPLAWS